MFSPVQQCAMFALLLLVLSGCGGGGGGGGGTGTGPTVTVTAADTLYSFGSSSTDDPMGPFGGTLIKGSDGNFYGTALGGGTNNGGFVFTITPTGTETVLHRFNYPPTGANPAGLIQASDGNFYGTTSRGGAHDAGTVFKLTPEGVTSILYSFGAAVNGPVYPSGGVVQGTDGNFYGATTSGGPNNTGTVFKLTPEGVETTLYTFGPAGANGGGPDGNGPLGPLVQGSDGNFYGVTLFGGEGNCPNGQITIACGTVFKVTPEGVETILHSFSGPDGEGPETGLIQGSDGNFYGTTSGGSNNFGTVFEITPDGFVTILYAFPMNASQSIGGTPGGLTQGSDGNFYGTTAVGGENEGGTVFQLTPGGSLYTLYSFPSSPSSTPNGSATGAGPATNLVQGNDGNLYGATDYLGAYGEGYFYKLVLSSN